MQGSGWIEPDKRESVCVGEGNCSDELGWTQCVWIWRLQGWTGINPGCCKTKKLSQDLVGGGDEEG